MKNKKGIGVEDINLHPPQTIENVNPYSFKPTSNPTYFLISMTNSEKMVAVEMDFEDIVLVAKLIGETLQKAGIKCKIVEKLKQMVPHSVLGLMIDSTLYNIPTEEREKKIKILKNLGLPEDATDEQIKEKIRSKERDMLS